ncbi:hypothetical protein K450DRAFT_246761 [Umbelopsis ramanniana AG]|uniref:PH domain-containing protein n=1 Tax=Umbelopsis ramanniana AG TaxID=1314678 RepID=A0AAD5HBW1_UMBRA|nr:uncharacterized protein K450DRAFT_246761 [Umbelopsis ramanniana AG]KAI8578432.1 hypothetical protein K450DRAFT_246761 [Umbelopsis ramanniana AG]
MEQFVSHHQTFDMSEVVEVEPRSQQYHQNIKYEFRMLIKRDDISFATEDPQDRKDWVVALTAIMGKVSLASQSELKNRVSNAENMTRGLQNVASELELECVELQRQLEEQTEEYMVKERKLREQWNAKEKAMKRELEDSQRSSQTRTELLERELGIWKGKCSEFEKRNEMILMKRNSEDHYRLEQAEEDARKWKTKATDLEATNELLLRQYHRAESLVAQSKVEGLRMDGKLSLEQAAIKDAVSEMRLDLSKLSQQMQSSSTESRRVVEIQDDILRLSDAMADAKKGYEVIHQNVAKLVQLDEGDEFHNIKPEAKILEDIQKQITELKGELIGSSSEEDKVDSAIDVSASGLSISSKFDALMALVETLHNKKVDMDNSKSEEMSKVLETIQTAATQEATLVEEMQKASEKAFQEISEKYESLSEVMQQMQANSARAMSHMESTLKDARDNHTAIKPDDLEKIYRKVRDSQAQISDVLATELQKLGEHESRRADEQEKSLSVLSQLFQHVANQIDNSAIPDLPDYMRQMDEMLDRLSETELRLTELSQVGALQNGPMSPRDKSGPMISSTPVNGGNSAEIVQLLQNTRSFMERTLRVLDKFGGSAHGFEQIIKNAVKQAMPATENYNISKKSNDMSPILDEKLKRYEDNARGYMDKSMEGMRNHLEDYTGVMYKMIEDLILRAMEHLESSREKENYSGYTPKESKSVNTDQLNSLIEMQSKLSANKQVLEADIKRLLTEKDGLSKEIRQLQAEVKELQEHLMEGKAEFIGLQRSSDHINQTLQRLQNMAPLIKQMERLQMMSETAPRS